MSSIIRRACLESLRKFRVYERIIGENSAKDALDYTRMRDEMDSNGSTKVTGGPTRPKAFLKAEVIGQTAVISFDSLSVTISMCMDRCFRITWEDCKVDTQIETSQPYVDIVEGKNLWISEKGARMAFDSIALEVEADGTISFYENNKMLRKDEPPEISDNLIRTKSWIREDSSIFGFGERSLGMDLRGSRMTFWNHDPDGNYGFGKDPIYIGFPAYMDLRNASGYLAFYNNPARGRVDVCSREKNKIEFEFEGGGLDYYVGIGKIDSLIEKLSAITGKPHLPPKWALGFHQSRYSYMSTQEVRDVADGFQKRDLPISAIHLDIDYMDGFRIFTLDKERFPDLGDVSRELKDRGIRLVSIIDPGVKVDENYYLYKEGRDNDYFVKSVDGDVVKAPVWPGLAAFPDFTRKEVRQWWATKYSFLEDLGISGYWHDMNEPVAFTVWGDNTLPLSARFSQGNHSLMHNLYGLYMAKGTHDHLTENPDAERPFLLTRSSWAGIQRYAFVWTGDCESTWTEMEATVSTILNLGMSGIPFSGVDIGGFSGSPSPELFSRWFQMASFFPLFRVHSAKGTEMREPWRFGDGVLDIIREFLNLRYRLLPYYYSMTFDSHKHGFPIIRPAFWIDSSYEHADGSLFMVGDAILVVPVTKPNLHSMVVRLPSGKWFSMWNDSTSEGLCELKISEERTPVFVKAGSIIPMEEDGRTMVHVFLGDQGRGSLYVDDGKVSAKWLRYEFQLLPSDGGWTLTSSLSGNGFPQPESIAFKFHGAHNEVFINNGTRHEAHDGVVEIHSTDESIFIAQ